MARHNYESIIKMDLNGIWSECADRFELAQGLLCLRAFVNTVLNFQVL